MHRIIYRWKTENGIFVPKVNGIFEVKLEKQLSDF